MTLLYEGNEKDIIESQAIELGDDDSEETDEDEIVIMKETNFEIHSLCVIFVKSSIKTLL